MGDRVLIQIVERKETGKPDLRGSPTLYMHWSGAVGAVHIIERTRETMGARWGDLHYSFARLTMHACLINGGETKALSVGVWNADGVLTAKDSHGDAGVFIVDISEPTWKVTILDGDGCAPPFTDPRVVFTEK